MSDKATFITIIGIIIFSIGGFLLMNRNTQPTDTTMAKQNDKTETQATELKIEDIEEGTGETVESGDSVVIHYKGTLTDGSTFDSSYDRGEPFETQIGVGHVIEGWDKGVVGMKAGGKRKLTIPPEMGYGEQAVGPIPANSTLIFEVELLEVLK